jgi:hypothetical protein
MAWSHASDAFACSDRIVKLLTKPPVFVLGILIHVDLAVLMGQIGDLVQLRRVARRTVTLRGVTSSLTLSFTGAYFCRIAFFPGRVSRLVRGARF